MKKRLFCLVFLVTLLAGCSIPMNMNNVVKEANFSGIVEEVHEKSILIKVDQEETTATDLISVSLDVDLKDSKTDFKVGDRVRVYYDGNIAESYPAQVNKVYAIILVSPPEE